MTLSKQLVRAGCLFMIVGLSVLILPGAASASRLTWSIVPTPNPAPSGNPDAQCGLVRQSDLLLRGRFHDDSACISRTIDRALGRYGLVGFAVALRSKRHAHRGFVSVCDVVPRGRSLRVDRTVERERLDRRFKPVAARRLRGDYFHGHQLLLRSRFRPPALSLIPDRRVERDLVVGCVPDCCWVFRLLVGLMPHGGIVLRGRKCFPRFP